MLQDAAMRTCSQCNHSDSVSCQLCHVVHYCWPQAELRFGAAVETGIGKAPKASLQPMLEKPPMALQLMAYGF